MLMAAQTYLERFKSLSLEECIVERDKVLFEIMSFEKDPDYDNAGSPPPMVKYQWNLDVLKGINDLIAIKLIERDPHYVPHVPSMMRIREVDITKTGCKAVVNAANPMLDKGGGVCGAIFKAAGEDELLAACQRIGRCPRGSAVITSGFDLCDYIIHAVGPIYVDGRHHEPQELYNCYYFSLEIARDNNITSIAFPLISSGIYGYPKIGAWKVALNACSDWIVRNYDYEMDIVFACIDEHTAEIGRKMARELEIELKEDEE